MFIAMNRFQVKRGHEQEFERMWTQRDTHLKDVPGFVEFQLLRGPEHDTYTLFASHTVWSARSDFEDWTRSEAFRKAHRNAGKSGDHYLGHPQFEGFDVIQAI